MPSSSSSSLLLSRTVALVTGGSSGLGAAAARQLIQQGARVVVADLPSQRSRFEQWTQSLPSLPGSSDNTSSGTSPPWCFADTNVTDPKQVSAALDTAEQVFGEPIDAVVHCAGMALAKKTLNKKGEPHPLEDFVQIMNVNTTGTFVVSTLAAQRMSQRVPAPDGLRGCLVLTASIAAMEGQMGQVAYAASKGAIVGMTLPMARDLSSVGIRVVTIAPGLFKTPLLEALPEAVQAELGATVPCPRRLGHPDEFGSLVVHVLTNPMLNGTVLRLDGALRMPP